MADIRELFERSEAWSRLQQPTDAHDLDTHVIRRRLEDIGSVFVFLSIWAADMQDASHRQERTMLWLLRTVAGLLISIVVLTITLWLGAIGQ